VQSTCHLSRHAAGSNPPGIGSELPQGQAPYHDEIATVCPESRFDL
jgi:hypothetical protein